MLIATVGASNANSYVTAMEAEVYFADRAHASVWTSYTEQESALITATSLLEWYVTWRGTKSSETQALGWPRAGVSNEFGTLYSETSIPQAVKTAVFELALSSIETDRSADNDLAGLAEVKIGSLQLKTTDNVHNKLPGTIPDKIWKILRGLTSRGAIRTVWLNRA